MANSALVSKLVPCVWFLRGALEILRLQSQGSIQSNRVPASKLENCQEDNAEPLHLLCERCTAEVSYRSTMLTSSDFDLAARANLIVIIISRFLQRPQKRSHGNQLIHSLSKTKSTGSGSDPESGRQPVMVDGVWSWDGEDVERRGWIRIGFVEGQCFEFGVKELWRDGKRSDTATTKSWSP